MLHILYYKIYAKQVGRSEGKLPQNFFFLISAETVYRPLTLPYIDPHNLFNVSRYFSSNVSKSLNYHGGSYLLFFGTPSYKC